MHMLASFLCLISLFSLSIISARAESLVSAISSPTVSITSNFTGADILVFGEVNRDAASVARANDNELIVVVEGPPERMTTWRKERLAGIWINATSSTYAGVPSFYAVHASTPLTVVAGEQTLKEQRIGLQNLPLAPIASGEMTRNERKVFRDALIRKREEIGLFVEKSEAIKFLSPTLFATNVELPSNIAVGEYTITTYLFNGQVLLHQQQQKLHIAKEGFEQHTFSLSRQQPLLYGILAVALALFTGWLAGIIFRKD
ncbi:TIGR02186 family protein [Polycladidibacter hongkongensis]|uniref:TIGR02186 family protein n=1 Tax=Polycladidibacter hongkongensis TaxID=1647556 RepID=UPI000B0028E8|nr:TIGR02186 family protein [Pseudovibrio hongkongensis]